MSSKISVVGTGMVGCQAAFLMALAGLAEQIALCCEDEARALDRARAEATDMNHAIAFTAHTTSVSAGTVEISAGSDVVVIAAAVPFQPGMDDRRAMAGGNATLFAKIVPRLAELSPSAVLVVVTNPVDVMTWHALRLSGFPWQRVIGTGTMIDSARWRRVIADTLRTHPVDIKTYMVGEHGPAQVPLLAHATVGGADLRGVLARQDHDRDTLNRALRECLHTPFEIFRARGYTNYAIAAAVQMIAECVLRDRGWTLPVSVLQEGYQGVSDVCLSVPCVVGLGGVRHRLEPLMDAQEAAAFHRSGQEIRAQIGATS